MRKVLIANRGEIAVRIARACGDAGLASVAVYAVADRGAAHVRAADQVLPLNGITPAETYLDMTRVLRAAADSGADAGVGPGSVIAAAFGTLLAKLIVTGASRVEALQRASRALREFEVGGVATSLPFYRRLVTDEAFAPSDPGRPFSVHAAGSSRSAWRPRGRIPEYHRCRNPVTATDLVRQEASSSSGRVSAGSLRLLVGRRCRPCARLSAFPGGGIPPRPVGNLLHPLG